MNMLVLFEVDPTTNEALGAVHPFCSERCRDACTVQVAAPEYLGAIYVKGTNEGGEWGFVPKCESCGIYITLKGRTVRCPDNPVPRFDHANRPSGLIAGCGHVFTDEPDDEGLFDCPKCGMWFDPDNAENQPQPTEGASA